MHDKTPLDRAVLAVEMRNAGSLQKFPAVAKLLRDRGSELTMRSAVALGEAEYLRKLYAENPKAFAPENGDGPLTIAVRHERIDMLRFLLDLGCDPDERIRLANVEEQVYSWGFPLWHAAAMHRYDMAELLLQRKADPNAQVYASGGPLSQAYGKRDERMKDLLRRHGAKDDAATVGLFRDTAMARRMLDDQPPELTRRAWAVQSVQEQLLWGAACGGDPQIVQMSLEKIDWKRDDPRWFNMLEQPLRIWNHGPGHWVDHEGKGLDRSTYAVCFKLVLDRCDPNLVGKFSARMLHRVAALGSTWGQKVMTEPERTEFTRLLLDAGADMNVRDDILKSTPLAWAARWGHEEMVQLLIDRGARVDEPDAESWATPLAWAEKMRHAEIAAKLRAAGAMR
jgi:ankyrin repeat protein